MARCVSHHEAVSNLIDAFRDRLLAAVRHPFSKLVGVGIKYNSRPNPCATNLWNWNGYYAQPPPMMDKLKCPIVLMMPLYAIKNVMIDISELNRIKARYVKTP